MEEDADLDKKYDLMLKMCELSKPENIYDALRDNTFKVNPYATIEDLCVARYIKILSIYNNKQQCDIIQQYFEENLEYNLFFSGKDYVAINIPAIQEFYDEIFNISSYTFNGKIYGDILIISYKYNKCYDKSDLSTECRHFDDDNCDMAFNDYLKIKTCKSANKKN